MRSTKRKTPSFTGLRPASERASAAARGASLRKNTLRTRPAGVNSGVEVFDTASMFPGCPAALISCSPAIALWSFATATSGMDVTWNAVSRCSAKATTLRTGLPRCDATRNADRENDRALEAAGWKVLRFWETDVLAHSDKIADEVIAALRFT